MRIPFSKLIFFGIALFCVSVFAGEVRERFEESYRLSRKGRFGLENTNGTVILTAWDRNEVKVEAEKIAKAGREEDAHRLLEATEIIVRTGHDYVEIDTRTPKSTGDSFWGWLFGDGGNIVVNYRIMVPEDIYIKVSTVNGKVRARTISGRAELASTNGAVEVEDAIGSVSAETTNGRIFVSLAEVESNQSMRFETTNGSIQAEFPDDFSAAISARTTNGSINCDFPMTVQGRFSRNALEGRIGHDGGRLTLRTTNGSISIRRR